MSQPPVDLDNPEDDGGDGPPSRVVPGLLSALAILPLGLVGSLVPVMLDQWRVGTLSFPNLVETVLAALLLVAAIVLMFLRRRGPRTLFVLSAILGLASFGAPYGRIVLGVVMVAAIGAFAAAAQARPRAP